VTRLEGIDRRSALSNILPRVFLRLFVPLPRPRFVVRIVALAVVSAVELVESVSYQDEGRGLVRS